MIGAVVFDIGNVLIRWHPERVYDALIGKDRRRRMFAEVDLHAMNDRIDRGANWQVVVQETGRAFPEYRAEIQLWYDRWLEMATPEISESWELLEALKGNNVPVFALSNFGIETFDLARKHYPKLERFDRAYISGHLGVTKPAPRIYEIVEETCGIPPENLLFADDRAENIQAAAARGWKTHLFDGPENFRTRLEAEGLL